jgi:1-acyl-sn-glycerol-3-phosphate acyltransferase
MMYVASRFIVWVVFKVIWRLKIIGRENIPAQGPVIIAANHRSYADPPIVGISIERHVHFIAKKELFDFKPFGWLITRLNAHPLNRSSGAEAIRAAEALLKAGNPIIIFPEGGRSTTEEFRPPKAGVGLVAKRTNTPVVPAYIHNSPAHRLIRFKQVSITFGKPLDPARFETYQALAEGVMAEVKSLKEAHPELA